VLEGKRLRWLLSDQRCRKENGEDTAHEPSAIDEHALTPAGEWVEAIPPYVTTGSLAPGRRLA
jgi:hypothetical protein